jgi:pectate lyase
VGPVIDGGSGDAGLAADTSTPPPSSRLVPAPDSLFGWATVAGLGLNTTTGGAGARVVTVTSPQALMEQASSAEPLYIQVCGEIEAHAVEVASNKTIVGLGPNAIVHGGFHIGNGGGTYVSNVIVRNLTIHAATSAVGGDGVHIDKAHHVWLDHLEIYDSSDETMSVTAGSDFVTVSWNHLRFTDTPPDAERRLGLLIGDTDDLEESAPDVGRLRVTVHHNLWGNRVRQRCPRVRFGDVHVVNNYYTDTTAEWSIWAANGSRLLIEGNYFDGVANPHETTRDELVPAEIAARDNVYDNTTGVQEVVGSAFVPPYDYPVTDPNTVPEDIQAGTGPR